MYDLILELAHNFWKNGLSISAIGTAVYVLLKQRKVKKRLKRYIPYLLADEEVNQTYVNNQHAIMQQLNEISKGLGITCPNGVALDEPYTATSLMKSSTLSQEGKIMKSYLKKLGSKKFQAFLLMTATNGLTLYLVLNGVVNIDEELEKYMPAIQTITQLVATSIYLWVEGSLDKARIQNGGSTDEKYPSADDAE